MNNKIPFPVLPLIFVVVPFLSCSSPKTKDGEIGQLIQGNVLSVELFRNTTESQLYVGKEAIDYTLGVKNSSNTDIIVDPIKITGWYKDLGERQNKVKVSPVALPPNHYFYIPLNHLLLVDDPADIQDKGILERLHISFGLGESGQEAFSIGCKGSQDLEPISIDEIKKLFH
jgi:hypothetical protein